MKHFADDDSDRNFESSRANAQTSGTETGASDARRAGETNASRDRADGAGSHAPDAGHPAADARERAEKAGEEEIEVTAGMKEAGAGVLMCFDGMSEGYWAEMVYRAMEAVRTS
jgi:hypothetical protein